MATYDELARQHATNAKAEYEQSLGYLTENLTNQKALDESALKSKYDALLETINRQTTPIEEQYAQDAQAAYVNKMLAGQQLNTTLSQLGVDTQGFGVNQRLANENAYGQNLAALQKVRSEGLRDVANQATDAMNNYNVAAQELAANYAAQQSDLAKYMQQLTENHYNNEYSKYLEDLRYQDQLKQQEWERNFAERQLEQSNNQFYASLNTRASGTEYNTGAVPYGQLASAEGDGNGNMIYTDKSGNIYKMKAGYNPYTGTRNNDVDNGTFSNGYQPNNVNNISLAPSGVRTQWNGREQNVWTTGNGNYYVWDGKKNKYIKLNDADKKGLGLK